MEKQNKHTTGKILQVFFGTPSYKYGCFSTHSSLETSQKYDGRKTTSTSLRFNASTPELSAPDIDQAILHQRRYLLFGQRWSIIDTQNPFLGWKSRFLFFVHRDGSRFVNFGTQTHGTVAGWVQFFRFVFFCWVFFEEKNG